MRRLIRFLLLFFLFVAVAYATLWGTLAIWYKLPGPDLIRGTLSALFALLGASTLLAFFWSFRWQWITAFALFLVVLLTWWNTLQPPSKGNWSREVARQTTGSIKGDILTLENVRVFDWRSEDDFDENWVTRTYDLSQVETVDLFMSYWGGPTMGHLMLSYGFANGDYLTWSNEVRRTIDGEFSPVADFFKANPIAVIASEERDVVGLRSNIQKSRVHIFRLNSTPENRRKMIEAYVNAGNAISKRPRWFNSVFTNCSSSVIMLARNAGIDIPLDYRIFVNGYFPDFLYAHGSMNKSYQMEELYELGNITERAIEMGLTDSFSAAIREGVPKP